MTSTQNLRCLFHWKLYHVFDSAFHLYFFFFPSRQKRRIVAVSFCKLRYTSIPPSNSPPPYSASSSFLSTLQPTIAFIRSPARPSPHLQIRFLISHAPLRVSGSVYPPACLHSTPHGQDMSAHTYTHPRVWPLSLLSPYPFRAPPRPRTHRWSTAIHLPPTPHTLTPC